MEYLDTPDLALAMLQTQPTRFIKMLLLPGGAGTGAATGTVDPNQGLHTEKVDRD